MNLNRSLFFGNLAQTSAFPMGLEIERAEGVFIYDTSGKKYFDLISGISVSSMGHGNPKIIRAIKEQSDRHLHLMVYGEYIQSPQVLYAKKLVDMLSSGLDSVYFVNSGTEAIEGAMKLSKRFTGRTEIISFKDAYHGSTQGALSICGNERLKDGYRPLLPDVRILEFNVESELAMITDKTAAVFVEPIQGEAGVIVPSPGYLKKLKKKCVSAGALLVVDEIQTGFGRTGTNFCFEAEGITPDILCLGKAMGGGMPLGAFVSRNEIMRALKENPVLGHLTTFGGHPVSCAAALASLEFLSDEGLAAKALEKEKLFRQYLKHRSIKAFRGRGLLLALEFENAEVSLKVITNCIERGVIVDWFLFADHCLRIAPPLTISEKEIKESCEIILGCLN